VILVKYICAECGKKHGHPPADPHWHKGQCSVCKQEGVPVTDGRAYGVYYVEAKK
jgi:Zn finger protein HypA/HybF involved in hydrogenase expression